MSVVSGCPYQVGIKFREHVRGFLSPGTTQTVRITRVYVKRGLTVLNQVHKIPYFCVEYSQRNHQVFASFRTFTDLFFFFLEVFEKRRFIVDDQRLFALKNS